MNLNYRSFLTGLMTAIPLLSTIKFGSTEIVELVPKNDKFRELIVRTTNVRNKWLEAPKSNEYTNSWDELLDHINNDFDPSLVTRQEVDTIFDNKVSIFDDTILKTFSEGSHPIAAIRELISHNEVRFPMDRIHSEGWKKFSDNYVPVILR